MRRNESEGRFIGDSDGQRRDAAGVSDPVMISLPPKFRGARAMQDMLLEYLPILLFLGIAVVLGGVLMVIPLIVAPNRPDPEKNSTYECGFNAFEDARMKFDVRFYLVGILFIIFDLEVALLIPWAVTLSDTGWFGFASAMTFLGILTIGFIYEWKKGALEWE